MPPPATGFQNGDESLCNDMDKFLAPRVDRAATVHAIVQMLREKGCSTTYKRIRALADKMPSRYVRVGQTIVLATLEDIAAATPTPQTSLPEPGATDADAEDQEPGAQLAYPCELCNESFPTEKDWIRHINTNAHKVKQAAKSIEAAASGRLSGASSLSTGEPNA